VTRLTLTVTPDGAINAIEVEEADGAITRFTFTGEQPGAEIPAETFHFHTTCWRAGGRFPAAV